MLHDQYPSSPPFERGDAVSSGNTLPHLPLDNATILSPFHPSTSPGDADPKIMDGLPSHVPWASLCQDGQNGAHTFPSMPPASRAPFSPPSKKQRLTRQTRRLAGKLAGRFRLLSRRSRPLVLWPKVPPKASVPRVERTPFVAYLTQHAPLRSIAKSRHASQYRQIVPRELSASAQICHYHSAICHVPRRCSSSNATPVTVSKPQVGRAAIL